MDEPGQTDAFRSTSHGDVAHGDEVLNVAQNVRGPLLLDDHIVTDFDGTVLF